MVKEALLTVRMGEDLHLVRETAAAAAAAAAGEVKQSWGCLLTRRHC